MNDEIKEDVLPYTLLYLRTGEILIGVVLEIEPEQTKPQDENFGSEYEQQLERWFIIRFPYVVQDSPGDGGRHMIKLTRWMPMSKDCEYPIRMDQIVTSCTPNDDLVQFYVDISGLELCGENCDCREVDEFTEILEQLPEDKDSEN